MCLYIFGAGASKGEAELKRIQNVKRTDAYGKISTIYRFACAHYARVSMISSSSREV